MLCSMPALRWPSLDELLEVFSRRYAQHESSCRISDNSEVLLLSTTDALEEFLQLCERGVHRDQAVPCALALEPRHRLLYMIALDDLLRLEQLSKSRHTEVAKQFLVFGMDDSEVGVISLEGRHERCRDGRVRRCAEGWWWIEVFYIGLVQCISICHERV